LLVQIESDDPKIGIQATIIVNSLGKTKSILNESLFSAGTLQPDVEGADRILGRVAQRFHSLVFADRFEKLRDGLKWVRISDGFHQLPNGNQTALPVAFDRIRAYRFSSFFINYQKNPMQPQEKLVAKGIGPVVLAVAPQRYWAVQLDQQWNQGWTIRGVYLQDIDDSASGNSDDVEIAR
jgi:hypothetical protein